MAEINRLKVRKDVSAQNIEVGKVMVKGMNITATDIQKMKPKNNIGGYVIDGGGSTIPLLDTNGGQVNLFPAQNYSSPFAAEWVNKSWDKLLLFKGWEIFLSNVGVGGNATKSMGLDNKQQDVIVVPFPKVIKNEMRSYRLKWIGYPLDGHKLAPRRL